MIGTSGTAAPARLEAIDVLRGLVIVLMVVDHAREYSAGTGRVTDPMTLDATGPLLYWMRWASHLCAPVFTLLAGASVGLQGGATGRAARMRYLVTRGLVLVVLEFTVVHFAWTFSTVWPMRYAQVIWGLGLSLIVLGLLHWVPARVRWALGAAIVAGHNLLDGWHVTWPPALHWAWAILHDRQVMPLWGELSVRTSYPVLPMIGLVLVGEALGHWYRATPDANRRRRVLLGIGAVAILAFVVLRVTNVYGDPTPSDLSGAWTRDVLSMLNATKYPMSLAFVLMTLGPACLLLAAWDRGVPRGARWLRRFGTVPMFVYIAHLYLLHALAIVWALALGFPWSAFDFRARITGLPASFGFPLWVTLPFVAVTLALLWWPAGWYARLRASRRYAFTRYI